ncbi:MAG TPA: Dyp-type peroxidase [Thermoanaerobaculia bacterium]|nr:Dyp-type peroxidase [Thermoanaerobaculia bacterium]
MKTQNATRNEIWSHVQRGLVYPAPFAIYALFGRKASGGNALTKDVLTRLLRDLREEIHSSMGDAHTSAIAGVGFALWREWSSDAPAGMQFLQPDGASCAVFARSNGTLVDSGRDLFFHIKSDKPEHCKDVLDFIRKRLEVEDACVDPDLTLFEFAARKKPSPGNPGGKILGCRFSENLNNATDPLSLETHVIIDDDAHRGGSFVLTQRFHINWSHILNMTPDQIEDLVGRTTDDVLIPSSDTRSHIKCARVQDGEGDTMQILRLSLPFGRSRALENSDLISKGASLRDEEGIFFAAYAKNVGVFETILNSQIGPEDGLMRDRLLAEVKADAGGFFYVPSQDELALEPVKPKKDDVTLFPGVDWSLLDRHFNQRSDNGLMFYNHKDYLYTMTTATGDDRDRLDPPSHRVLQLLANAFSRWQDAWYFDRKQQELEHLCAYVARKYGPEKAREVMSLSVAERMGWTVKVSLGDVFTSHAYGFRGRKLDAKGNWINGADTYRIHPQELIVGALPNLGLGQGRYVIDYAREDERVSNFFVGLSFASGVGHTVPAFQRALDKGIGGMLAEVEAQRDAATDASKRQFYAGVGLALEGVRDYSLAYARLAGEMGLEDIRARMTKLATEKPETMLEAAQLIFTMHASLHLIGEPTAIGRLDQMLNPFYEADRKADRITEAEAQEIIDCFWIKIGEKVLINRTLVEDHQPFGNLAMGGMSGNYPQGGANNQWIQQVTVGGTVADDAKGDGKPAYNDVTIFCLRAARRLPLNAPCLSLRTRADMPENVLHEASLALLSGGAHPILLSDEKVIPGLVASGEGVGGDYVRENGGGLWSSAVPLRYARDYACDGCYEPQLSGVSWFTLGGLTMPQVLEASLNQGKAWASAGPIYFRGQRVSFTSPPPSEIREFDDLVNLFFEHMRWMYAKQADGTVGVFAQMQAVCPSPLLSALTGGCLEKGLDYYGGGPLFNVIAPGFMGLSTTIDSLWAIRTMVFDPVTAVTSLPHLVEALLCNWGENMQEPFVSSLEGEGRIAARAERYRKLRNTAMHVPKFGRGNADVDEFGGKFLQRVAETARRVFTEPVPATAQKMVALAQRLGTPEQPFGGFQIQPGVGTFENYVEFGAPCGASADGRHSGDPLASDLSPSPTFADLPVSEQTTGFLETLAAYTDQTEGYSDGAPTDFSIREDFPVDALTRGLRAFAKGAGSNILTVTCADPETLAGAAEDPEKYDVLRVRMGGWTEFFVAMFPAHQSQHQRRPMQSPEA